MTLRFEQRGAVGVLTVTGQMTASNADRIREEALMQFGNHEDVKCHVIDMAAVDFLDSSGLGVLVTLLKRLAEKGGRLRLAGLQKKVRVVFEITRMYKVFDIFETVDEALAKG